MIKSTVQFIGVIGFFGIVITTAALGSVASGVKKAVC